MKTKIWAYGTTRNVEVIAIEEAGPYQVVACRDLGGSREGFVLIEAAGRYDTRIGDRGVISFVRGGPTGGYWRFAKAETGREGRHE